MAYVIDLSNKRCPVEYEPYNTDLVVMTNSSHSIDKIIEEAIKGKFLHAVYTAWDFFGDKVWWQDDEWWCEIWQGHSYVSTIHAKTLEGVMRIACAIYGDA